MKATPSASRCAGHHMNVEAPMLDEEQAATDFQHASHFVQRKTNLRNAAASPCHYDRIQTAVRQRDTLRGAFDEMEPQALTGKITSNPWSAFCGAPVRHPPMHQMHHP